MPRSKQVTPYSQNRPAAVPRFSNPMSNVAPIPTAAPVPAGPGLGTIVKEGFAFGVGNAAAHRVFSSLFGPSQAVVVPSQPPVPQPCEKELTAFDSCMKSRTIDEHCHEQQLSYTQCLRLSRGDSTSAPANS